MRRSLPHPCPASRHHRRLQPGRTTAPPPPRPPPRTHPRRSSELRIVGDPARAARAARPAEPRDRARISTRTRRPASPSTIAIPSASRPTGRRDAAGASARSATATARAAGSPAWIIAPPTRTMSRRCSPSSSIRRSPRQFGRESVRAVTAADGELTDSEISGTDVGTSLKTNDRQSRGAAGRARRGSRRGSPRATCAGASATRSRISASRSASRSPSCARPPASRSRRWRPRRCCSATARASSRRGRRGRPTLGEATERAADNFLGGLRAVLIVFVTHLALGADRLPAAGPASASCAGAAARPEP